MHANKSADYHNAAELVERDNEMHMNYWTHANVSFISILLTRDNLFTFNTLFRLRAFCKFSWRISEL